MITKMLTEERFAVLEAEVSRLQAIVARLERQELRQDTIQEKRQALDAFLVGAKQRLGGPIPREELNDDSVTDKPILHT